MRRLIATAMVAALMAGSMTVTAAEDGGSDAVTVIKDSLITTRIKAAMAQDKQVSALLIGVQTDDNGVVELSGIARTQAEADRAVTIARSTEGVTLVRSKIRLRQN